MTDELPPSEDFLRELRHALGRRPGTASDGPQIHWDASSMWTRFTERWRGEESVRRLGSRRETSRHQTTRRGIGVLSIVMAMLGVVLLIQTKPPREKETTATYATRTGERASVLLPDGTHVMLAPQTTLRLFHFSSGARTVMLDGEAFFDVSNVKSTPFTVQTGEATTRVLGTTFFVKRYARDRYVRVGVTSGKVQVSMHTAHHQSMTLVAGNVGDINDSLAVVRTTETAEGEVAWLKDKLVFKDAPVVDVLAALSRWYGYQFRYRDSAIVKGYLKVQLSARSSSSALATLEQVLDVNVNVSGDTVTLVPRPKRTKSQMYRPPQFDVWTPSTEVGR